MKKANLITVVLVILAVLVLVIVLLRPNSEINNSDTLNASIKSGLASLRMKGETYYTAHNNSYNEDGITPGSDCASAKTLFSDPSIKPMLESIALSAHGGLICSSLASGKSWAISATLNGGAGNWCVDSNGGSKAGIAAGGVCI